MHHAYIDKFAYQDSPVHRLDARVKFLVTLVFTAVVISLPRDHVSLLASFAIGPFVYLVIGRIPIRFVLRHILMVSPFIAVLALTFLIYERHPVLVRFGPLEWEMAAGWLKCFNVLAKFVVTMAALVALVSTTRFNDLLIGLQKMGVPSVLVIQLGFLYRYIFLLIDKAHRLLRARSARRLKKLGFKREFEIGGAMVGSLLVRTLDSAENISRAMQGRGFTGSWPSIHRPRITTRDFFFVMIAGIYMTGLYLFVVPLMS